MRQGFYFTSFGDLSVDEEDGQQEQWQYPRHVCHLMALPPKEMTCCRMIFYKLHSLYDYIDL